MNYKSCMKTIKYRNRLGIPRYVVGHDLSFSYDAYFYSAVSSRSIFSRIKIIYTL